MNTEQPTIFGQLGGSILSGSNSINGLPFTSNSFGNIGKSIGDYLANKLNVINQNPIEVTIPLIVDGQVLAKTVSTIQYDNTSIKGRMRGVKV